MMESGAEWALEKKITMAIAASCLFSFSILL